MKLRNDIREGRNREGKSGEEKSADLVVTYSPSAYRGYKAQRIVRCVVKCPIRSLNARSHLIYGRCRSTTSEAVVGVKLVRPDSLSVPKSHFGERALFAYSFIRSAQLHLPALSKSVTALLLSLWTSNQHSADACKQNFVGTALTASSRLDETSSGLTCSSIYDPLTPVLVHAGDRAPTNAVKWPPVVVFLCICCVRCKTSACSYPVGTFQYCPAESIGQSSGGQRIEEFFRHKLQTATSLNSPREVAIFGQYNAR